jgi:hypothetical protein
MGCINIILLAISISLLTAGAKFFINGQFLAGGLCLLGIFVTGTVGGLIMTGGRWR